MEIPGIITALAGFGATAAVFAILALGLNVQWGYTGLFNIGVAGFFAIGAYTSALVYSPLPDEARAQYVKQAIGLDQPFLLSIIVAGLVCGVIAIFIGIPTLRLREDYLAIATIGIAETIRRIFNNERWLANGPQGMSNLRPFQDVIPPDLYNLFWFGLTVVVMLLIYLALERGIRSPWGRVLRAIREDEIAAEAMGKDVFWFKMQSLILGSIIMGIGGALYAHFVGFIQPQVFTPLFATFVVWVMLILGGSGNNKGAIIGAFLIWGIWAGTQLVIRRYMPADLSSQASYIRLMIIGLMLVSILLVRPQGILGEEKEVSRLV